MRRYGCISLLSTNGRSRRGALVGLFGLRFTRTDQRADKIASHAKIRAI
jgi:hypothetical protein